MDIKIPRSKYSTCLATPFYHINARKSRVYIKIDFKNAEHFNDL